MKTDVWEIIKSIIWYLILIGLGILLITFEYNSIRDDIELKKNGVVTQGTLQNATLQTTTNSINHIPTGNTEEFKFDVNYLDLNKKFDVSSYLFNKYVNGDKFTKNAPIDILYLPSNHNISIPFEMVNDRLSFNSIDYFLDHYSVILVVIIILFYTLLSVKRLSNKFKFVKNVNHSALIKNDDLDEDYSLMV